MSVDSESDDFASAESDNEELSSSLRGTEAAERDEGSSAIVDNVSTLKASSLESPPMNDGSGGDVDSSEVIEKAPTKPSDKIELNDLHSPLTEDTQLLSSSLSDEINTSQVALSVRSTTVTKTTASEPSTVSKPTPKIMSVGAELGLLPDAIHEEGGEGSGSGGWGGWGDWGSSLWSSVSTVAVSAQAIGQKVTSVIATVEDSLGVPSPQELVERGERDQVLEEKTRRLAEDMVEHDVSQALVIEEPHSLSDHGISESGSEQTVMEDGGEEILPGNVAETVSSFFSGFASVIQNTGQGFVSGGLDALETLGKKTMEVLSDGDPGLVKKRAMLGVDVSSSSLSQLLREAKAEGSARAAVIVGGDAGTMCTAPLNYSRLFDEYHGVGHLEALELLSKECVAKNRSMASELSEASLYQMQEKLEELTKVFTVDDDQSNLEDDTCQLVEMKQLLSSTSLPIKSDKLLKVSSSWRERVNTVLHQDKVEERTEREKEETTGQEEGWTDGGDDEGKHEKEDGGGEPDAEGGAKQSGDTCGSDKKVMCEVLYENGLRSLAELTSASIELFRKIAEVCLLPEVAAGDPVFLAQTFNRLTVLLLNELDALASVHSEGITELDVAGTNSNVTSLYLESSNSGSYVQDAFQLLLPVLKVVLAKEVKVLQPAVNIINRN